MAAIPTAGDGLMLLRNHEEIVAPRISGKTSLPTTIFEIPAGTEGAPEGFPGFGGGVNRGFPTLRVGHLRPCRSSLGPP